jgi:hypothetical protein
MLLRATRVAGAAAGAAALAGVASVIDRSKSQAPPLCGVYELAAGSASADENDDSAVTHQNESAAAMLSRRGLLVYRADGRMWAQCSEQAADGAHSYTGYEGRWWLHGGAGACTTTFSAPPHGGYELVEHNVRAASEPSLVGKTMLLQYALSNDGQRLTTTDVQLFFGEQTVVERLEWRRIGSVGC